eukprot:TRINITY_DN1090_c0_g1_i9.p1 TRINITY_DN1090_c0_g1~~TRINITY_DN1090_c0_g1_i9.p1  ORF type:complete len:553 (+),score=67.82 TRINITY_DN1090_c0_g1_i9:1550-3208(+)
MTWSYQHLLNAALQAALTLILSYAVGRQIQHQTAIVMKGLSVFLNSICIPAISFWAIGIKLDLTYEGHWKFLGAFLIQTALFVIVITVWVLVPPFGARRRERQSYGRVQIWTEKFSAELVTSSAILGPLALEGALGKEFVPLAFLTTFNNIALQLPILQIMLEKSAQSNDEMQEKHLLQNSSEQGQTDTSTPSSSKEYEINKDNQKLQFSQPISKESYNIQKWDSAKSCETQEEERALQQSIENRDLQTPRRRTSNNFQKRDFSNSGNTTSEPTKKNSQELQRTYKITDVQNEPLRRSFDMGYSQHQHNVNEGSKTPFRGSLEMTRFSAANQLEQVQNEIVEVEIHVDQEPDTFKVDHRTIALNKKESDRQVYQLFIELGRILFYNPIMWAIAVGIVVSVTGLREFLDPQSAKTVVELSWLESALGALGSCLTPIALVVTGLWIANNHIFKSCHVWTVAFDLIFKFLVIPLSMIPIAVLLGLRGEEAKASIILSAMPMALVVVPLAQQYNVAVNDLTVNLVLGLVLMFPCIIALMEFVNYFDWFNDNILGQE